MKYGEKGVRMKAWKCASKQITEWAENSATKREVMK